MADSPQYLLRFDDLCPTLKWSVWERVERVLQDHRVTPILAVVPDNRDPKLYAEPPNAAFWDRVRRWQQLGWTIALHGYQHLYVSKERGLVGRRKLSEFAGLGEDQQRLKLTRGLEIFQQHGITPTVWVAPGHTFDTTTVLLLKELGVRIISDGFFRRPCVDASGMLWIPQQLWSLRDVPDGVWTVCHHINANEWTADHIERFQAQVAHYRDQIVSVPQVEKQFGARRGGWWETRVKSGPLNFFLLRLLLKVHALARTSR